MTVPADAARERRHLQFLADASAILVASLEPDAILRNLARMAVPDVAQACVIDVVDDDGRVRRAAIAHIDPARGDRPWDAEATAGAAGVPEVVRTGTPLLVPTVHDEARRRLARGPADAAVLAGLGLTSAAAAPMVARGRTIGS